MKHRSRQWTFLLWGIFLSGCASSPTFLSPNSSVSAAEADLYRIIFYMALGVFVLVEGWLLFNIIRFRQRPGDETQPRQIYGNTRLEIIWTAIPVLLVGTLFFFTVRTVNAVASPSAKSADIQVTVVGHRWWWEFDYPALQVKTANELHVPVGANVEFTLESADVIHSFWVPQLSGKTDVIPGQTNHLWFRADQIGNYHGQCAEFCGENHANMRIKVVVESQADYDAWVADQQKPLVQPQTESQQRAFKLITSGICSNCHTLGDHEGEQSIGPNLTHLFSRSVFAGATFDLTKGNLDAWLQNTQAMKPGNDMKVNLTSQQIDDLMSYLPTLK